ncbi:hypothetical protein Tsubulata_015911 [Turnera subulata]|uniref:Mal d 1-associated protein n=1 Tax=Turnera subulata TaxID=218843 RepID=A0A9Q0F8J4_9ROSI|nr:hypothetical protein Tsubulata_015911 [Turnera subulata]
MGWVWRDDDDVEEGKGISGYTNPNPSHPSSSPSDEVCSTRRTVKSKCRTEEVEPGKFLRKCEKTEEVLRECLGKPVEVVESNKEYTEEDVTEEVTKGGGRWLGMGEEDDGFGFGFPGLRSDIENMERRFLGGINRFFQAAEEMRNGLFDAFGDSPHHPPPSFKRGIPIETPPPPTNPKHPPPPPPPPQKNGDVDLSGLARDV